MTITYRNYGQEDADDLMRCMEQLQDHLVKIDPLKRLQRLPCYGGLYTNELLRKVSENDGKIVLAYSQETIVGCSAGIIERPTLVQLIDSVPSKTGRVIELFVSEQHRGQGIGKELMSMIERYFVERGCDTLRVEVFEPNNAAHEFYKRFGCADRVVDMIKKIG